MDSRAVFEVTSALSPQLDRIKAAAWLFPLESVPCYHDNALHERLAKYMIKIIGDCLYLVKSKINPQKNKVNNNLVSKTIKNVFGIVSSVLK